MAIDTNARLYVDEMFGKYPTISQKFPVTKFCKDRFFETDEAKEIVAEIDKVADERFNKYRSQALRLLNDAVCEISETEEYKSIVVQYTQQGEKIGTILTPYVALVSTVASLYFSGGITAFLGSEMSVLCCSAAVITKLTAKDEDKLMAGGPLAFFIFACRPEIRGPLALAEAAGLSALKSEWPTQLGEKVGKCIGEWVASEKSIQGVPDLAKWKVDICKSEKNALDEDIKLLSKKIDNFKNFIIAGDQIKERDLQTLNNINDTMANRVKLIESLITILKEPTNETNL